MSQEPLTDDYPNWIFDSLRDTSDVVDIHIFGPYRGDCRDILEEIVEYLQVHGYQGAKLCIDLPDPPRRPDMPRSEFNWWKSVWCMYTAQAGVFIFLEPTGDRLNDKPSEGLNASAFAELAYWANFFAHQKMGTHVVFEEGMANSGSLISGFIEISNATEFTAPSGDIQAIKEDILTTCIDWLQE